MVLTLLLAGCLQSVTLPCYSEGYVVVPDVTACDDPEVTVCPVEGDCFESSGLQEPRGYVVECREGETVTVAW